MKRFLIKVLGYDFGKFGSGETERATKKSALATAERMKSIYADSDIIVIDRKTDSIISVERGCK